MFVVMLSIYKKQRPLLLGLASGQMVGTYGNIPL